MEGSIFSKVTGRPTVRHISYFMNLLEVQELKLFIVVLKNLGEFPRSYLQNCCSFPEKPFLSTNWQDCWKCPSEEGAERFFQSFSHHG